jgi:hypothetical protein
MDSFKHEGKDFSKNRAGIFIPKAHITFEDRHPILTDIVRAVTPPIVGTSVATMALVSALGNARADTTIKPISLEGSYNTFTAANFSEGFQADGQNVPTNLNTILDFRQEDIVHESLPYDGLQGTATFELNPIGRNTPTFGLALRSPRVLDDWLSIAAAVEINGNNYTGSTFFASLSPDFLRGLEVRGGVVISHNQNHRGEQPNGGFGGFRYRNDWLTIDADMHGTTGLDVGARGFIATYIDVPGRAKEQKSFLEKAEQKVKELFKKTDPRVREQGVYLSAGANSNESTILSHLAYVNKDKIGGFVRYNGNWENDSHSAHIFLADTFRYNRHDFDQRNRQQAGTEAVRLATGEGFPGWLPPAPLGTQNLAGSVNFSLDANSVVLDASAHYVPIEGLFLELGLGYSKSRRNNSTETPRIIAGIIAPIYDKDKIVLAVRGVVDPTSGDTNAMVELNSSY